MKLTIRAIAFVAALSPLSGFSHTVENMFNCYIYPESSVNDVIQWKQDLLTATRELGFAKEEYDAELWVPIMSSDTATNPKRIVYRGKFKDFATQGRVMQAYLDTGFENKVRDIMHCKSAEQWTLVPDGGLAFQKADAPMGGNQEERVTGIE